MLYAVLKLNSEELFINELLICIEKLILEDDVYQYLSKKIIMKFFGKNSSFFFFL